MADGNNRSFFRRVVDLVAPAAGERSAGDSERPSELDRESDFARSELKAMIERKRRNDFVRKRELDMLRKLRRQGLTPAQLAALGSSSGMADTEGRLDDAAPSPAGDGMKAKIDEIEQQMAGHAIPSASRRPPRPVSPPSPPGERVTLPGRLDDVPALPGSVEEAEQHARSMADTIIDGSQLDHATDNLTLTGVPETEPAPAAVAPPSSLVQPRSVLLSDSQSPTALEVSEVVHDPELDEAVIAYANGDNEHAEQQLRALIAPGGARSSHAETWMVVFDLYRATGQQASFEALAAEFAERLGRSAPQWFSMPRLVAEAAREQGSRRRVRAESGGGPAGWGCPPRLDAEAVELLRTRTLTLPLPWVLDWSGLQALAPDALEPLLALLRHWAVQPVEMRWIAGEQLLAVLAAAAPSGDRDADPLLWQLRMQVLRIAHRPDQFDEAAIDYCVTYEVSPPSWEPAACRVRLGGVGGAPTVPGQPTQLGEVPTSGYGDSRLTDEAALQQVARGELSGQLVGDIAPVLTGLEEALGGANLMEISCARLLRVDFMAAGDLLNWVIVRNREGRVVSFVDTNRLVALFFSAMGIDAHATVKVRLV